MPRGRRDAKGHDSSFGKASRRAADSTPLSQRPIGFVSRRGIWVRFVARRSAVIPIREPRVAPSVSTSPLQCPIGFVSRRGRRVRLAPTALSRAGAGSASVGLRFGAAFPVPHWVRFAPGAELVRRQADWVRFVARRVALAMFSGTCGVPSVSTQPRLCPVGFVSSRGPSAVDPCDPREEPRLGSFGEDESLAKGVRGVDTTRSGSFCRPAATDRAQRRWECPRTRDVKERRAVPGAASLTRATAHRLSSGRDRPVSRDTIDRVDRRVSLGVAEQSDPSERVPAVMRPNGGMTADTDSPNQVKRG
jgi:hypothetical protein